MRKCWKINEWFNSTYMFDLQQQQQQQKIHCGRILRHIFRLLGEDRWILDLCTRSNDLEYVTLSPPPILVK